MGTFLSFVIALACWASILIAMAYIFPST